MNNFNFLCTSPPDYIVIDDITYPIHTDFRNWIKIDILLSGEINAETIIDIISLCYKLLPKNIEKAVKGIIDFYTMYSSDTTRTRAKPKKIYSFKYDSGYIYSAFIQCYGIDLSVTPLHWWHFRVLFSSLGECTFTKIMHYRNVDLSTLKTKEQKAFYRKMKNIYRLPDESHAEDIGRCLDNLF